MRHYFELTRTLAVLLALALPSLTFAADSIDTYFFRTITNPNLQEANHSMIEAFDNEQYDEAVRLSENVVEIAEQDETIDKMSFARALSNAAILQALAGDRTRALALTGKAIETVEDTEPFHSDLFNILMVKSYTHNAEDMYVEAEDTLRRAQHIAHRQDGVYTRRQLSIIEFIAGIKLAKGELKDADQEQRFNLIVSERNFGAGSEEIIPTLQRLGAYFADRGGSIPLNTIQEERLYRDRLFRESTSMFERSIQIIESKYGDDDLRLIDPLKGLSRTKDLQGFGRANAERPMEKALAIILDNPASDLADQAKAMVSLADLYTKTSNARSSQLYLDAWNLLAEDDAHEDLRYELFGRPLRLVPEVPVQPVLFRHPVEVEKGTELFVDVQYDIRKDGRVRNAKVVDGNVPNGDRKLMRDFVSTMRFRPRIQDGELLSTEGMLLHQTYRVREREPKTSISISTGTRGSGN
jgi:tetratricopeptide (TPR) repeat protein